MFSHLLTRNAKRNFTIHLVQVGSRMIVDLLFLAPPVLPSGCSLSTTGDLSRVRSFVATIIFIYLLTYLTDSVIY